MDKPSKILDERTSPAHISISIITCEILFSYLQRESTSYSLTTSQLYCWHFDKAISKFEYVLVVAVPELSSQRASETGS